MKHIWTVESSDSKKRLDIFLSEKLPKTTRSQVAKLLKYGAGKVNGKPVTVHRFLNEKDKVEFDDDFKKSDAASLSGETPNKQVKLPPLVIVDKNADFIVIDKPTGLLVHPDSNQQDGTLVDLLLDFDPKIAKIGEYPERPGIMHRLDREVSGLMVVARTQDAFDDLKRQFAEHSVDKKYLALVHGEMLNEEGDIKFRIAHSKTKNRMAARPKHEEEGKAAWTHYVVLKRFRHASLVELTIMSGRTHQIRAHLLALGHPVMGDDLYAAKQPGRSLKAPRLMLQCIELGFKDPKTGEPREYKLKPVNAFAEMQKKLS